MHTCICKFDSYYLPQFVSNMKHAYAIIRADLFHDDEVPIDLKITVKKILASEVDAESEMVRLNALNGSKGCYYFWRVTRIAF